MSKSEEKEVGGLDFEEAMEELEGIVGRLRSGKTKLGETVRMYERGGKLHERCRELLEDARLRIEKIEVGLDGKVRATSAEGEVGGGGRGEDAEGEGGEGDDDDELPF